MVKANIPYNENKRLEQIYSFDILDTDFEKQYDDLVSIAQSVSGKPIALLSIVDKDRQWFKSCFGLEVRETSRDAAFCAHAILKPHQPLIVENALNDARFLDNPLVLSDPNIRFYAGFPLNTTSGYSLGTLCVIGDEPDQLSDIQIDILIKLSQACTRLIEFNKHKKGLDDIINERTQELVDAKQNLELSSHVKSRFLSNMGHEFRTPIHAIINYSNLSQTRAQKWDADKQAENSAKIYKNAQMRKD